LRRRSRKQSFELSDAPGTPAVPAPREPAQQSLDQAYESLLRARRTASEIVQRARDEAKMILETARSQADTITFEARNLSQDFLDRLRDLRERAASLELEDPATIVRRLMASTPPRPDAFLLAPSPGAQGPRNGDLTAAAAMFWAERASSDRSELGPSDEGSPADDFWLGRSTPS
jgi:hypothetical protein